MKNTIILFLGFILFTSKVAGIVNDPQRRHDSQDDTLLVYCTPSLTEITTKWANEYSNPNVVQPVKIETADEAVIAGSLIDRTSLALVSGDYSPLYEGSMWNMVIGREVIVPVYNMDNPFFSEVCRKGITIDKLADIIKDPVSSDWGKILNINKSGPVHLYRTDDEFTNDVLVNLTGTGMIQTDGAVMIVKNTRDLIADLSKDPYAIGICKLSSLLELSDYINSAAIKLLPIDRNNNGQIDHMENIYDDINMFSRNVWIGKYPHILYRNIYSISHSRPVNDNEISFLKWILTDGQKYLSYYGFSELVLGEKQSKVRLIDKYRTDIVTSGGENYLVSLKTIAVLVLLITGLALSTLYVVRRLQKRRLQISGTNSVPGPLLRTENFGIPLGLFYDKSHTWAYMERDGLVKIGIDDFLQHITGKLTGVKMKVTGETVTKGEPVLTVIQDGKQLTLNSPVSGTIRDHNERLSDDSSLLNSSPFNDGWIYRIEPSNWLKEISFFIMGNNYSEWLRNEFTRLKEFLNTSAVKADRSYIQVLQDGGELKDGILENLSPEIWEEFQTNFIDVSS